MNRRFNKVANFLIFGMGVGILIVGCGGGSGGAGTSDAAASFVADHQGGGFVGSWWYAASTVSVAKADTDTMLATGTNQYTGTTVHNVLSTGANGTAHISGSWGTDSSPNVYYDLISTGWVQSPDTASMVVDSDGRHLTITPAAAGEPALITAITKTNLENTSIACTTTAGTSTPCVGTGLYPAGSRSYQFTFSYTSSHFILYGNTIGNPVTNSTGAVLANLPALNTTFCDPTFPYVFEAKGAGLYNVWPTTDCTLGAIAAAIAATTPDGTVTMQSQATGNATGVTTVLHVSSATGITKVTGMVGMIYGARASAVWYGWMSPAGTYTTDPGYNKTAINAQLLGDGLVALP